jgi:hypothetical protein
LVHAAAREPIFGSGAAPHSKSGWPAYWLIAQGPFQMNAFWPLRNAMLSASWATLAG